jgi:hypothetical protein
MRATKPKAMLPPNELAFSIPRFCELHGISQIMYFRLQQQGLGPQVMKVGARTLISAEAAAKWRRDRERGPTNDES